MRKLEKLQIIKNVGSSWFSLGLNILIGVFLSPFILHRLGDAAFGIWVLIFSSPATMGFSTSVFALPSFATFRSTPRRTTREEVSGLINTAMFTYTCVGALSMIIMLVGSSTSTGFSTSRSRLFNRRPAGFCWWWNFRGLGFPLGVFGGMLEGLQRSTSSIGPT